MFEIEDHYEGAWVLDKCQGHGILPCAVGTVYEGQWRNDVFNERGTIVNCSGDICDGLWINGYPAAANSRGLEIWAGIRNHHIPLSSANNLFELIEETERRTVNSCQFWICTG
ncbi:MORN repeat-containing protein 1 isoform X1 [Mycteria americana]|uniref:MORN repeat-containing protein 1 isoform X1 n=1 Tax=Mycteria americana TaxID=33587 RepID=UPI003F5890CD